MNEPGWDAVRDEVVGHLQQLIRIDTVNPPGNEMAVARYLESVLVPAGVETRVLEPAPGRAAVYARLRGSGERAPVLLLAHMDVVGVEADHWSVDPFGGVVKDGYVYGRGAIDDKGMLAANLVVLLLLKRQIADAGQPLARDVLLLATSDEEAGGTWGIGWVIAHHPELVRAEFALNEGGRVRVVGGRPLYVAVQTAEKVPYNVKVSATGPAGHSSVPRRGNAIARLARALAAIDAHREPVGMSATTRAFFAALGGVWPWEKQARAMIDVASSDPTRVQDGARALEATPVFDAVLRNGISPTILAGGVRANVIPAEATANLNVRLLPGESIDALLGRLRAVVDDPSVTFQVADRQPDPPASPIDSAMFAAIRDSARVLDPRLAVAPYLSTGATDSARLRHCGVAAYGILPFPLDEEDESRMHGHDERVPIAALEFGTRLIYGAVHRVAR
ncbi:MAG TPA: M20/M25/M40 family metallo-hydrolase [Gemmatimonadaceae bacterium]|nr:M20/M25/M40 family metallo-hydrolase [Gemmatimonadaceae bacterium]